MDEDKVSCVAVAFESLVSAYDVVSLYRSSEQSCWFIWISVSYEDSRRWSTCRFQSRKSSNLCDSDRPSFSRALSDCFSVWLKHYTSPFEAVWYGALRMCLILFLLLNFWKSSDVICGPLSETICSGIPCVGKSFRSLVMVLPVFVFFISKTSGHFEYASTTTRNDVPWNGPARSMWICGQGLAGHVQGCNGACLCCWHWTHVDVVGKASVQT